MADENENIRTLWTLTTEDIRFWKTQQYTVANYALLLFAAIVAVRGQLVPGGSSAPWLRGGLVVVVLAALAGSWLQIRELQSSLMRSRNHKDQSRDHLCGATSKTTLRDILSTTPKSKREGADVDWMLQVIVVVAAVVTIGLVVSV
jgi:hypothetical protein